jgi:hypothetical protein
MTIIFATILCISVPAYIGSEGWHFFPIMFLFVSLTHSIPQGVLIWIGVFRIILGIGVGGDYPMSASITGDRASLRKRGTMLIYVFANQGWGSFVGSLVTMAVLACYKKSIDINGQVYKIDAGEPNFQPSASRELKIPRDSMANRRGPLTHPGIRHALSAAYPSRIHSLQQNS